MKQTLDDNSIKALVKYRIERSNETMLETKLMIDQGYLNGAINRMYYACFYIVSALLVKNKITAQTHAGVKQMLGLHFVLTGKLSPKIGSIYASLFEKRHSSDYDDFAFYDVETVEQLFYQAKDFIRVIMTLIDDN